ncbi:hypothetical protein [Staphylococcus gallinarum]|nr:hypothetical protein [Staphylococcus gallinarum]MDW4184688.1 hypothetical protein [Staphylococcus saprophyticus]UEH02034.1 hypothetical protein K3U27_06705 [Staphylococcus gallinarum]
MSEEIEVVISEHFTDLQLTKDNSIQSIPLSNEEFERLTSIRVNEERD